VTLEIMMPFYGRPDHLKIAVESVIAQSNPDWRLTVVDDVYPDLTAGQWVAAMKDSRITYIRNSENLRPSKNYNKCVGLARENFVVIMGCDDVMLPGFVQRVSELVAKYPDADIIQPGVSVIDENGQATLPLADRVKLIVRGSIGVTRVFQGADVVKSLLRGNWTYFPSLVWRRDAVAKFSFREDLNVVQDLDMIMKILLDGGRLVADSQTVFNYRRHSVSYSALTGSDGTKFAQERQLFEEVARECDERGWAGAARSARLRMLSRANAAMELPQAVMRRDRASIRNLSRHVFGG